jgi:membrane glycosyltransferase
LLFKSLASIVIVFVLILIAGLSGLTFRVWPTGFNDYKLTVTPEVLQRLHSLQSERKFGPDSVTFYPGAVNERERLRAQEAVDSTIQVLITELPEHPQRSTVLRAMKAALAKFDTPESEERDQVLAYLTKVMEICSVHSSAELFNVWRYGFPYGWFF